MKPKQDTKVEADKLIPDIKGVTRRKFSAEEKLRIVLAGCLGVATCDLSQKRDLSVGSSHNTQAKMHKAYIPQRSGVLLIN
jgi:transposase-like protein